MKTLDKGNYCHRYRVSSRPFAAAAAVADTAAAVPVPVAAAAGAGMINLNTPRCRGPECYLTPYFGLRGATPTYCSKHKQESMINVISKRCEDESCDRIPSYNYDMVGAKAVYCNAHKAEGGLSAEGVQRQMVRVFVPAPFQERSLLRTVACYGDGSLSDTSYLKGGT